MDSEVFHKYLHELSREIFSKVTLISAAFALFGVVALHIAGYVSNIPKNFWVFLDSYFYFNFVIKLTVIISVCAFFGRIAPYILAFMLRIILLIPTAIFMGLNHLRINQAEKTLKKLNENLNTSKNKFELDQKNSTFTMSGLRQDLSSLSSDQKKAEKNRKTILSIKHRLRLSIKFIRQEFIEKNSIFIGVIVSMFSFFIIYFDWSYVCLIFLIVIVGFMLFFIPLQVQYFFEKLDSDKNNDNLIPDLGSDNFCFTEFAASGYFIATAITAICTLSFCLGYTKFHAVNKLEILCVEIDEKILSTNVVAINFEGFILTDGSSGNFQYLPLSVVDAIREC